MKSRGSLRNRVRPVAVELKSAAPAAEPEEAEQTEETATGETTQMEFNASDSHKNQKPKKSQRKSLGGRVSKTESRSKHWSLRRGLTFLKKKSKPAKNVQATTDQASKQHRPNIPKPSVEPNAVVAQNKENASIAGTGGALGLTPLTQMFRMQSITNAKSNQKTQSIGKKRAKEPVKTQEKQAKSRILRTLNRSLTFTSSRKGNIEAKEMTPIKPTYTFGKRRSEISTAEKMKRTSLGSLKYNIRLPREVSTGTLDQTLGDMDMSLETSIMNTLYPDGKSFMTNLSDSLLSDSIYSYDTNPDESLPPTRRLRSNSMRLMRRNASNMISTSPRLSQTVNLGNEQSAHENDEDGEKRSCMSTRLSKNILDDSYIKAQLESLVTPQGEEVALNKRDIRKYKACSARVTRRVSPIERACMKKEVNGLDTPRCSGLPVRRSRSLRMWGREQGQVVSGYAGHTPRPRRRRPSYDERLIM